MKKKTSYCVEIRVCSMPTDCSYCQFNDGFDKYCVGINDITKAIIPTKGKNINCPLKLVKYKKKK